MRHWNDPEEVVTLTIRLPRSLRARIKATAVCAERNVSDLIRPVLAQRFDCPAMTNLQRDWIEGWKAQQDNAELERLYGGERP